MRRGAAPIGASPRAASPRAPQTVRVAVDTGGTFTDCVYVREGALEVLKLPSTPADPGLALLGALEQLGAAAPEVRHGTTVGTNTLLERSGARVAFVTTAGFEDTLAIGRQARPHLYRWSNPPPVELAPAALRFGIEERTLPDGRVERAVTRTGLEQLFRQVAAAQPEAVAVSLLFGFANPANEERVGRALEELGVPVSLAHEILPEFREYERGATVVINACLAPRMGRYLRGLEARLAARGGRRAGSRLQVMQSSGGIIDAATAAREPVRTILSGPAGGVVGACRLAQLAGWDRIISFDMGGTSTDVALMESSARGQLHTSNERQVLGMPVAVPMLDIHTVGAGGGSIAGFDAGGALRVGPQSAGADPGPACYGRGDHATVTDANLVLGRLGPEGLLGGRLPLDAERARRVLGRQRGPVATVEAFAAGIVALAEATMAKALRQISIERGHDPRQYTLVSFGGAGPLHACALAEALEMPRVLVPRWPGALSALGILLSDLVRDESRTVMEPAAAAGAGARLDAHCRALEQQARRALAGQAQGRARAERALDLRYAGQGYEISVAWPRGESLAACCRQFHELHQRRFGYADAARPIEVVTARVRLTIPSPPVELRRERPRRGRPAPAGRRRVFLEGGWRAAGVYDRARLHAGERLPGPAVITEYSATTVVPSAWAAAVDGWGNLVLERKR